jgi:hypothetical protein
MMLWPWKIVRRDCQLAKVLLRAKKLEKENALLKRKFWDAMHNRCEGLYWDGERKIIELIEYPTSCESSQLPERT